MAPEERSVREREEEIKSSRRRKALLCKNSAALKTRKLKRTKWVISFVMTAQWSFWLVLFYLKMQTLNERLRKPQSSLHKFSGISFFKVYKTTCDDGGFFLTVWGKVQQIIPCLHLDFFFFLKWRLVGEHHFHCLRPDKLTVAQWAKATVDKCFLRSCMWSSFPDRFTLCLDSTAGPLLLCWVKTTCSGHRNMSCQFWKSRSENVHVLFSMVQIYSTYRVFNPQESILWRWIRVQKRRVKKGLK